MKRCPWGVEDELYVKYHDEEWGVPVHDDIKQFEFLVLESAQAGLSWLTVLRKRENYRKAYDNFDPLIISKYNGKKIKKLLNNPGIIRNKMKIEASINNAKRFLEIQKEFGSFDRYIWSFTDYKQVVNKWKSIEEIPSKTELSDSTIIYAHLQAVGIVNDHIVSCFRYSQVIDKNATITIKHKG